MFKFRLIIYYGSFLKTELRLISVSEQTVKRASTAGRNISDYEYVTTKISRQLESCLNVFVW